MIKRNPLRTAIFWVRNARRLYVTLVYGFLLLPVVVVILASLTTTSYLTVPPKGITLRWFWVVLGSREYIDAIFFSLALAVLATIGSMAIGTASAYALIRRAVPGSAFFSSFFMAPLIFPGVVVGVALLQFYSLVHMSGTFAGLVLAHMVITVPYMIRSILASLAGVDAEIEDAACVLGANRLTAFFKVTLPMIRPGVVAGGLFSFIISFDNIPVSIFLLGVRQMTLPVKIFTTVEYGVDPSVAAVSTILIIATSLFLVAAERWVGFHQFV
jgi:putative spermidine/putrescine transport system permease protein